MALKIHETRGFTLIELVVAVSLALILTSVIIANYNSYNNVQALKQAALTLKNDLRFIQSKALSGEKPSSGCSQLVGWMMSFAANSYSFQANCTEGAVGTSRTISLPSGVSFMSPPPSVTFQVLTRGIGPPAPVILTLSGFSKQYRLQLTSSGDISDLGLQ